MRIRAAVVVTVTLVVGLIAALISTPATAGPPPAPPTAEAKINPALRAQLTQGSAAPVAFWVRFGERPDLSAAAAIDDWTARGTAVADALRRAADSAQRDVRAELDASGVRYRSFWATNAIRIEGGSLALAEQLAASAAVEGLYATTSYDPPELDARTAATREAAAVEWGIANIKADDVWNQYGDRGAGITVASIDTGVQYDHPALVKQYRGTRADGTFDHNYNWFDAAGTCGPVPCDKNGHGTHTMGTMIGAGGIGVAPDANWIAANGCCPSDESLIASGQWMLQPTDLAGQNPDAGRRPQVVNNSWGSGTPSNDPFMEDITQAWAASGIFAVWSNGNLGSACRTSGSPGSRTSNYSTGAYDVNNTIADFSSRGTGQDGEIKPNLSAPGVDVRSSVPGNSYAFASGTSMAAPHVAGAVALLWSAAPGLVGDVAATRALLDGSSVDTPDDQCGGTSADNNVYGEGRLNALALVDSAPVGQTGTLAVTVTDASTGKPVPTAALKITGPVSRERTAGEDGKYALPLPVGTYTVDASWFGYDHQTAQATVTAGTTSSVVLRLTPMPRVAVSGTVTDGSGQGWPLYAKITVDDVPGGIYYTSPETGRYSFRLPADASYKYRIEAVYPGYTAGSAEVSVQRRDVRRDVSLKVNGETCVAPGYSFAGVKAAFDGGAPDGWTSGGWRFDDPYRVKNQTGGTGGFAIAQTPGGGVELDAALVSPPLDLRARKAPVITFRQDFITIRETADVDLSLDGGTTWSTVLHQDRSVRKQQTVVPIPQAAGRNGVLVRFNYQDATFNSWYWQIDDVFIGDQTCGPLAGGLVIGQVSDRNTGAVLNGATVRAGGTSVRSNATPADAALADGFYWAFAPAGRRSFGASFVDYQDAAARVRVRSGQANRVDFRLAAGQLSVRPEAVSADVGPRGTATARFTVRNTGTAPAQVSVGERRVETTTSADYAAMVVGSNKILRVPGDYSPLGFTGSGSAEAAGLGHGSGTPLPAASPWIGEKEYPSRIMDNAVGEIGGLVYSVGGVDGDVITSKGYRYDPATKTWSPIADLPEGRQNAAGAFIGDTFYVSGGWDPTVHATRSTFGYDRRTGTWTKLADGPTAQAASGRAVLDGKLYLVGGCTNACDSTDVRRYDPASDTWSVLADYPEPGGHRACGAIDGKLYCAGGVKRAGVTSQSTYAYDPVANTWTKKADLPIELWGMAYTTSYDRLLVSGGISEGAITNEGFSYDPVTDRWSAVAPSGDLLYRGGSACGLTRVGGSIKSGFFPVDSVETLPTYGACTPGDVPWLTLAGPTVEPGAVLSQPVTLAPGKSLTVTLRLTAKDLARGVHTAGIWIGEDTPYLAQPVDVQLRVRG